MPDRLNVARANALNNTDIFQVDPGDIQYVVGEPANANDSLSKQAPTAGKMDGLTIIHKGHSRATCLFWATVGLTVLGVGLAFKRDPQLAAVPYIIWAWTIVVTIVTFRIVRRMKTAGFDGYAYKAFDEARDNTEAWMIMRWLSEAYRYVLLSPSWAKYPSQGMLRNLREAAVLLLMQLDPHEQRYNSSGVNDQLKEILKRVHEDLPALKNSWFEGLDNKCFTLLGLIIIQPLIFWPG
jgi:hypothetical protein